MPRAWAVVPAAGSGRRMGAASPSNTCPCSARRCWRMRWRRCSPASGIEAVVLVLPADDTRWSERSRRPTRLLTATGGAERCHSVQTAWSAWPRPRGRDDWVLVHDAARPCLSGRSWSILFEALAALTPVGGIARSAAGRHAESRRREGRVGRTPPREGLWRALTPQMFRYGMLRAALGDGDRRGHDGHRRGGRHGAGRPPAALVPWRAANLKVTGPGGSGAGRGDAAPPGGGYMRIGHGFDVHAFGPGDRVVIGGVPIEHSHGVVAHSDGDVALHALCDALLGAAGLGDIGGMFPDTDPRWAGADSRELLRQVVGAARRLQACPSPTRSHRDRAGAQPRAAYRRDAQLHRRRPGRRTRAASTSRRPPPRGLATSAGAKGSRRMRWCCCTSPIESAVRPVGGAARGARRHRGPRPPPRPRRGFHRRGGTRFRTDRQGEHLFLKLRETGCNTDWVAGRARALGRPPTQRRRLRGPQGSARRH
jgi:2-C-methyl-D-erythritol 4-phosphate cytidylyltransferase / 2-C-methyl-D-erythritol 2,4-cyclodiphosphate synthase